MAIDYSIIIPVYFNEGSLWPTYEILMAEVIANNQDKTYEIIFVDDGSEDNSLQELLEIRAENPKTVKVLKLSRNFGQPSARLAGYEYSIGKCAIHVSADLQDPPELMNQMLGYYFDENYEIVIAVRTNRNDSLLSTLSSKFFYSLIKALCFPRMPTGGFDFHLISDRVKKLILQNKESNSFFQGQVLWTGFEVKEIPYERKKREVGKSRWTFSKKMKLLIDGLLSYSYFPLRVMTILGSIISASGFIYALWIFIRAIGGNKPIVGWAPMMIIMLILSGFQMLMLGIIGEYLWRTLDQVRNRKSYIVESIYDDLNKNLSASQ